jgi:glutamate-1-semialdehyde 2,1-aminomutase
MTLFDKTRADADRFVPQVGTLSGNPIAVAAGLATLAILKRPGTYERYFETGEKLMSALSGILEESGIQGQVVGAPPMFDIVFADGEVRNYRGTLRGDGALLARLNGLLRDRGILKGEHKYYLSTAIDETDVEETIAAWRDAFDALETA